MKRALPALVLLALAGCGVFRRELPPWARPLPPPAAASAVDSPTSAVLPLPAAERAASPPVTTPAAPAAVTPVPPPPAAVPAPAAPIRPPAPPPAFPSTPAAPPVAAPPAPPSPPLTASLPPAEMRRLQDEAQRRIEEAERLLRQLDGRPLAPKHMETLRLAQSLVEQARKALGGQEFERAANLAAKARTLADDLSAHR